MLEKRREESYLVVAFHDTSTNPKERLTLGSAVPLLQSLFSEYLMKKLLLGIVSLGGQMVRVQVDVSSMQLLMAGMDHVRAHSP